ncbi:MAG: bifunctional phosphopantothenoylcysteine decarboxylase/phosphopantothenate--cysteine ligase CoaBC [Glaciihabitans sp.]
MNIIVGVTGGIAAYKAVGVVRSLVLAGHNVQVIATEAALRFVGRPTFEAISRNTVHTDLYEAVSEVRHVSLGQNADLIVIAPATANTIAKLAAGIADDLLGNTVLASVAPVVIAPAMHSEMWANPATVANVATLSGRGIHLVGPAVGQLTGKDSGPGRMSEPEDIVAAALQIASRPSAPRDLEGMRVLVTAGGTREPLDPVRFIGNRSSGRQGIAIAQAAAARGASVTLIAANLEVDLPETREGSIDVRTVSTTLELSEATHAASADTDAIVMAAAVADYRPETVAGTKIKKEATGDQLTLTLVKNPDILHDLAAHWRGRDHAPVIVGFAAETETDPQRLLELGRAKIARKGCDYLVVNSVGWTSGFATPDNTVIVLNRAGDIVGEASGSKLSVAARILDLLPQTQHPLA